MSVEGPIPPKDIITNSDGERIDKPVKKTNRLRTAIAAGSALLALTTGLTLRGFASGEDESSSRISASQSFEPSPSSEVEQTNELTKLIIEKQGKISKDVVDLYNEHEKQINVTMDGDTLTLISPKSSDGTKTSYGFTFMGDMGEDGKYTTKSVETIALDVIKFDPNGAPEGESLVSHLDINTSDESINFIDTSGEQHTFQNNMASDPKDIQKLENVAAQVDTLLAEAKEGTPTPVPGKS